MLLQVVAEGVEQLHVRIADLEQLARVVALGHAVELQGRRDRRDGGDVGVHASTLLLGLVGDVDHAPLVQHAFQVKAALFFLGEGLTPPRLQIKPQIGLIGPRQGVVFVDDHWLTFVGHQRLAVFVVAMHFPDHFDLVQVLDVAFKLGLLSANVNDPVATGQMHACWYGGE